MKNKIGKVLIFSFILIVITLAVIKHELNDRKLDMFIKDNSLNRICQDQKYDKLKEKGIYSDKYLVKNYIKEKHPHIKCAKVLYETTDPEDIKNFELPASFVMKYSSGAKASKIYRNNRYDYDTLKTTAVNFMKIDYATQNYRKIPFLGLEEPQYKYNQKRIIFEEFLGEDIYEFRVMLVKGKIAYYEMIRVGDDDNEYEYGDKIFDKNFNRMYIEVDEKFKIDDSEQMLSIKNIKEINKFCKDFYEENKIDLVRVDFYISGDLNDYYFGELTFTPDNCRKSYNDQFNEYIFKQ